MSTLRPRKKSVRRVRLNKKKLPLTLRIFILIGKLIVLWPLWKSLFSRLRSLYIQRKDFRLGVRRRPRWLLSLFSGLFFIGILAGGYFYKGPETLYRAQLALQKRIQWWTEKVGFSVERITIEGAYRTKNEELLKALPLKINHPILYTGLKKVKEKVEDLPWVASAVVQRRLPSTLYIKVIERDPMAIWLKPSENILVDRYGHEIIAVSLNEYKNLLYISGVDAPKGLPKFLSWLEQHPSVLSQIKYASFIGQRRWNIKLKNGMLIKLPEERVCEALKELNDLFKKFDLLGNVISVDMRLKQQFIIKLSSGATLRLRSRGHSSNI